MTEPDFETILELCLDRVTDGESVEACLRDYEDVAQELRPYLEVAEVLAQQPSGQPTRAADRRIQAFLRGQVDKPISPPGPFSSSVGIVGGAGLTLGPQLLALLATLVGVLLAGTVFSSFGGPALLGEGESGACQERNGIWVVSLGLCLDGDGGPEETLVITSEAVTLHCFGVDEEINFPADARLLLLCRGGDRAPQVVGLFAAGRGDWSFLTARWEPAVANPPEPSERLQAETLSLAGGSRCQRAVPGRQIDGLSLAFTCDRRDQVVVGGPRLDVSNRLEAESVFFSNRGGEPVSAGQRWLPVQSISTALE